MSSITFEIVTPEGAKFSEEVYSITLPTPAGQIGILPHHIPLITIVTPGVILIRRHQEDSEEQLEHLATAGGFVEIDGKRVRLLADSAERAEDIDELKVKEALSRAQEMRRTAKNHVDLAEAVAFIDHNLARLKVAELKRRHRAPRAGEVSQSGFIGLISLLISLFIIGIAAAWYLTQFGALAPKAPGTSVAPQDATVNVLQQKRTEVQQLQQLLPTTTVLP